MRTITPRGRAPQIPTDGNGWPAINRVIRGHLAAFGIAPADWHLLTPSQLLVIHDDIYKIVMREMLPSIVPHGRA